MINNPVVDRKFTNLTIKQLDLSCNISTAKMCSDFNGDNPWLCQMQSTLPRWRFIHVSKTIVKREASALRACTRAQNAHFFARPSNLGDVCIFALRHQMLKPPIARLPAI